MKKLYLLLLANKSLSPKLVWVNSSRTILEFKGRWFKQDKVTFTPNNVTNLFIVINQIDGHKNQMLILL